MAKYADPSGKLIIDSATGKMPHGSRNISMQLIEVGTGCVMFDPSRGWQADKLIYIIPVGLSPYTRLNLRIVYGTHMVNNNDSGYTLGYTSKCSVTYTPAYTKEASCLHTGLIAALGTSLDVSTEMWLWNVPADVSVYLFPDVSVCIANAGPPQTNFNIYYTVNAYVYQNASYGEDLNISNNSLYQSNNLPDCFVWNSA